MRCHDHVGLKFLYTVDGHVAAYQWMKNLAYGACITQDYFQPNRVTVHPGQTMLLFIRVVKPWNCGRSDVAQGVTERIKRRRLRGGREPPRHCRRTRLQEPRRPPAHLRAGRLPGVHQGPQDPLRSKDPRARFSGVRPVPPSGSVEPDDEPYVLGFRSRRERHAT